MMSYFWKKKDYAVALFLLRSPRLLIGYGKGFLENLFPDVHACCKYSCYGKVQQYAA